MLGGRIAREVWFRVGGLPPMTADDLDRRFVTPLSSLLALATSADCPPVAVEVAAGADQPWLSVHHSGLRSSVENVLPVYRQLLPLTVLGLDRVAMWLNTVEKLGASSGGSRRRRDRTNARDSATRYDHCCGRTPSQTLSR